MGTGSGFPQLPSRRRNVLLILSVDGPVSIPVNGYLGERSDPGILAASCPCRHRRAGKREGKEFPRSGGRAAQLGRENYRLSLVYSSLLEGRGRSTIKKTTIRSFVLLRKLLDKARDKHGSTPQLHLICWALKLNILPATGTVAVSRWKLLLRVLPQRGSSAH